MQQGGSWWCLLTSSLRSLKEPALSAAGWGLLTRVACMSWFALGPSPALVLTVPHPRNPSPPGEPGQLAPSDRRGPRGCGRGPGVSGAFASFAQPGVSAGHRVSQACSVAAPALMRPPGTQSTAHLHPDSGHKATLSLLEETLCSALNTSCVANRGK